MKTMKVQFGKYNCLANFSQYNNGCKAIHLVDPKDGNHIATATVNLPNECLKLDEVFINDYAENYGMSDALIAAGIIEPEAYDPVKTGFAIYFRFKLTHHAMMEFEQTA